jgi:hypothetical protein
MIKVKVTRSGELNIFDHVKEIVDMKKAEMVNALIDATPVDTGEASRGWTTTPSSIVNSVPHIAALNLGTSKQAPAYFIEQTILSTPGVKPNGQIVRQSK